MSIQANINLLHFPSATAVAGGGRRDPFESGFSVNALTLSTTSEVIPKGDLITPRYVAVKNYEGDDALISIDGGSTFPFRLSSDNDVLLFRLNFESSREVSTFVCEADTAASLDGKHLEIYDRNGEVWPYFSMALKAEGSITYGTPAVAVAATGSITFGVPVNTDTVIVNGTTLTKVAVAPAANEFTSIAELEALVEALTGISSSENGTVVSITAETAGFAGNSITLALGGGNTGTMAISGATLTGGLESTSVVVNGTTCTYVASAPAANQFSSISELEVLVEAIADITSTQNSTVVSIVADTAGSAGNAITLALGANIAGTTSVSGATLTGGQDSSTPPTFTTERLIEVTIVKDDTALAVAIALAAALEADTEFIAAVPTTATAVITDQHAGTRAAATAGDTGWASVTAGGQGADYYDVEIKSAGTSKVVTAVCPN